MSTHPTPRAWEADEFWSEVVNVITGGKKLRPDHYLAALDAPALESLRLALSSSGTLAEQQKLCPPRQGGKRDGEPPSLRCLSELQSAIRQVVMLRGLERNRLVEAAAKQRCATLGLNAQLTNAVLQVVGEEALAQHAQGVVGKWSLQAANALMKREGQLLAQEKFHNALKGELEKAMDAFAQELKGNPQLLEAYQRFRAEVNAAMAK